MRQSSNITRSRAVPILSGALVAILLVPSAALAGGFSAPNRVHHAAATGSGGSGGILILLGIVAVAVLSVVILSRAGTEREGARRQARSTRRKPAGIAS